MEQEKPYSIFPTEGTLKPFESVPVKVVFTPKVPLAAKGFMVKHVAEKGEPKTISMQIRIETAESSPAASAPFSAAVKLTGQAVLPLYTLSSSVLKFGSCAVHDHLDIGTTCLFVCSQFYNHA
jgi:hypothetical protein